MRALPTSALAAVGLTLAFAFVSTASWSEPPPSSTASASAAVSASAPPRPKPLPLPEETFDVEPFPAAPSERPSLKDWQSAKLVEATRRSPRSRVCSVFRLREWVKVRCALRVASVNQFGGNPQDAYTWVGVAEGFGWGPENGAEVMFRVVPGERRLFQFFELVPDPCVGQASSPSILVDASWAPGDARPTLVLR